MSKEEFQKYQEKYAAQLETIRQSAHDLHQSVNQTYGDDLPYGFHLDMVVEGISGFGHLVCACEEDYAPFVKLCDRLANVTYTCSVDSGKKGHRMREVYKHEMAHFLPSINPHSDDPRMQVPFEVVTALAEILIDEVDRDEMRRQWCGY